MQVGIYTNFLITLLTNTIINTIEQLKHKHTQLSLPTLIRTNTSIPSEDITISKQIPWNNMLQDISVRSESQRY
jgi:hypothetical protein